eukprot:scaffold154147_cov29-Tisochrysis_lutea.AAC.2
MAVTCRAPRHRQTHQVHKDGVGDVRHNVNVSEKYYSLLDSYWGAAEAKDTTAYECLLDRPVLAEHLCDSGMSSTLSFHQWSHTVVRLHVDISAGRD